MGRWEKTGFRGTIDELLDTVATTFPWTLEENGQLGSELSARSTSFSRDRKLE
jgi:hypothetical protein